MKIFKSDTVKNTAKLVSANAVAQAIGILFYPLLTRLYRPEDFGALNLFLSIGGVLLLFATADYQYALLLPKSDKKVAATFHGAAFIMLGIVALTGISVFFRHPIAALFKAPELATFYPLMPLFVLLSAIWVLLNYWFTREKNFGNISVYQVSQTLGNSLFKYGFGLAGRLQWGLFTGTILGLLTALVISIGSAFKSLKGKLFAMRKRASALRSKGTGEPPVRQWAGGVRQALRRYARFPLYSLPRSLVNNLSSNLPFFLLTPAFGLGPMGFFGMALTLSFRPVNMIIASVYQVLFQKFSEKVQRRESVRGMFYKFLARTFLVVVPCFAALYFILPGLCAWLLGPEWRVTGDYIRLMLPWIALTCAGASMAFISDIFQKQAQMLAVEIIYLLLRTAGLLIGIALHNIELAILLYSLIAVAVITAQLLLYGRFIAQYEKSRP